MQLILCEFPTGGSAILSLARLSSQCMPGCFLLLFFPPCVISCLESNSSGIEFEASWVVDNEL